MRAGVDEFVGGRGAVFDFEGDADVCAGAPVCLDGVDHLHLGGVGEFERSGTGVKDRDAGIAFALESGSLGETEHVTIEPQGGVEVFGFDNEAELLHTGVGSGWLICHVDYSRT